MANLYDGPDDGRAWHHRCRRDAAFHRNLPRYAPRPRWPAEEPPEAEPAEQLKGVADQLFDVGRHRPE